MNAQVEPRSWNTRAEGRLRRLERVNAALGSSLQGKRVDSARVVALLNAALVPFDRVCLEGDRKSVV